MNKLFYQTQRSYNPRIRFEVVDGESETIPGESMSIKDMVKRALAGIREDERPVSWFDQEDLDAIDQFYSTALDYTDLDELRRRNERIAKALEVAERKKKEAETEAAEDAKAEARLKAKAEREAKQKAPAAPSDPKPGEQPEAE